MASRKTIPVGIYNPRNVRYDGEPKSLVTHQFAPDTQVLLASDVPPTQRWVWNGEDKWQWDIRPFSPRNRRRFIVGQVTMWAIYYPRDLTKTEGIYKKGKNRRVKSGHSSRFYRGGPPTRTHRIQTRVRVGEKKVPHPNAGELLNVVSTHKLLGLAPGTFIRIYQDEKWLYGVVQEYTDWRIKERAEKREDSKARKQRNRYLKQPTWHERLRDLV